jgi:hypothetical protein
MGLILNSGLDKLVRAHIRGSLLRIGGNVNQLIDYRSCRVTDMNVLDGGYGAVASLSIRSVKRSLRNIIKLGVQELRFLRQGPRVVRDRNVILCDAHWAYRRTSLHRRFDSVISSNMIEHSPNPIWLLYNLHLLAKESGYQFHAIPHCKFTFDMFREPTSIDHLINDFVNKTGMADLTHNHDYYESAVVKHGWQRNFHERYPVTYPYIHFHVFDEQTVQDLCGLMFVDVCNDIIRTEEFGDNVVLYRNNLNPEFVAKFGGLLHDYPSGTIWESDLSP